MPSIFDEAYDRLMRTQSPVSAKPDDRRTMQEKIVAAGSSCPLCSKTMREDVMVVGQRPVRHCEDCHVTLPQKRS